MEDLSVLIQNADYIRCRQHRNDLLLTGFVRDLANMCKNADGLTDPIRIYRSVFGDSMCTPEFASFCAEVFVDGGVDVIGARLPDTVQFQSTPTSAIISYQQNSYSDRALQIFLKRLASAHSFSLPTTVSVCEEVYYGRSTHCILPIYSSQDGILTAFTKLISKYGLMINAVCDVSMADGDSTMRFALLSSAFVLPNADPCYLQFNAVLPQAEDLGKLIISCESVRAIVTEIITQPLTYAEDTISYTIRLRTSVANLPSLVVFLHTVLDKFTLEGAFSILQ